MVEQLWDELAGAAENVGGGVAGLGARDTLRTEMGYPLHGQDISPSITPVEAGMSWAVGWDKPTFGGREALVRQRESGPTRRLRALRATQRAVPRSHMDVLSSEGATVGEVTSGTFSPPVKELERIRKESAAQKAVYASFTPQIDLSQGFIMPLEGRKTSLYGHRRFFNDVPRSPHSGLDIAAPTGTPIVAPGPGRVALRGDFYFNGKTILLDHGQGLITMYCHMSEYMVEEGEFIDQGQMLGLVGSTGRSTGPHLHWSVSLNNFRIDPLEFLPAVNEALE